jgi:flagellar FliL protein
VLLLVAMGGGAAVVLRKKKAAAEAAAAEEDGEGEASASASASPEKRKHDPKHPPVFVPLEPFVVNLADKESDRYAQVGVTLEVEDAKFGDEMKAYMPAIRNGILMVLSHKTSTQLLTREGKLALAREIMREAALPMGIEADEEEPVEAAEGTDDEAPKKNKKRKKAVAVANPIKAVHFSNFIVQ